MPRIRKNILKNFDLIIRQRQIKQENLRRSRIKTARIRNNLNSRDDLLGLGDLSARSRKSRSKSLETRG